MKKFLGISAFLAAGLAAAGRHVVSRFGYEPKFGGHGNKYIPHQGEREITRRRRQIKAGIISADQVMKGGA